VPYLDPTSFRRPADTIDGAVARVAGHAGVLLRSPTIITDSRCAADGVVRTATSPVFHVCSRFGRSEQRWLFRMIIERRHASPPPEPDAYDVTITVFQLCLHKTRSAATRFRDAVALHFGHCRVDAPSRKGSAFRRRRCVAAPKLRIDGLLRMLAGSVPHRDRVHRS